MPFWLLSLVINSFLAPESGSGSGLAFYMQVRGLLESKLTQQTSDAVAAAAFTDSLKPFRGSGRSNPALSLLLLSCNNTVIGRFRRCLFSCSFDVWASLLFWRGCAVKVTSACDWTAGSDTTFVCLFVLSLCFPRPCLTLPDPASSFGI